MCDAYNMMIDAPRKKKLKRWEEMDMNMILHKCTTDLILVNNTLRVQYNRDNLYIKVPSMKGGEQEKEEQWSRHKDNWIMNHQEFKQHQQIPALIQLMEAITGKTEEALWDTLLRQENELETLVKWQIQVLEVMGQELPPTLGGEENK